jgi:hypothetical protein
LTGSNATLAARPLVGKTELIGNSEPGNEPSALMILPRRSDALWLRQVARNWLALPL